MKTARLAAGDRAAARELFALMAEVFAEDRGQLGDAYLDRLLARDDFWAIAAFAGDGGEGDEGDEGDEIIGGLTAHTLAMTRSEASEVFIYDLAVRSDHQRQGVGRSLVTHLREAAARAGIREVFVPADDDDVHALDFYRALGGTAQPVTIFTFTHPHQDD
jgi:aminoglycoside 3-N-acetyltransferase I